MPDMIDVEILKYNCANINPSFWGIREIKRGLASESKIDLEIINRNASIDEICLNLITGDCLYLVVYDTHIVGFCTISKFNMIENLYIMSSFRGNGIADRLIQIVIANLKYEKTPYCFATIRTTNVASTQLFVKNNFTPLCSNEPVIKYRLDLFPKWKCLYYQIIGKIKKVWNSL